MSCVALSATSALFEARDGARVPVSLAPAAAVAAITRNARIPVEADFIAAFANPVTAGNERACPGFRGYVNISGRAAMANR
jgi:hypothetical protein